jgi:hypothetical protein
MSTTGYQKHSKSLKKSVDKGSAPSPAPSSTSAFWLQTSAFGRQQSGQIDCYLGAAEVCSTKTSAVVRQRFDGQQLLPNWPILLGQRSTSGDSRHLSAAVPSFDNCCREADFPVPIATVFDKFDWISPLIHTRGELMCSA